MIIYLAQFNHGQIRDSDDLYLGNSVNISLVVYVICHVYGHDKIWLIDLTNSKIFLRNNTIVDSKLAVS